MPDSTPIYAVLTMDRVAPFWMVGRLAAFDEAVDLAQTVGAELRAKGWLVTENPALAWPGPGKLVRVCIGKSFGASGQPQETAVVVWNLSGLGALPEWQAQLAERLESLVTSAPKSRAGMVN